MGWVPTVGIELLLNSWKDNYLGALGKTPSMYVHMYVGKKKNITFYNRHVDNKLG